MMTSGRRRLTGGCAIGVVLLLAGFSATVRQPGAASDQSRLVDVGGHRLEALISGEGVPAVVFEAGFIGGLHWMRSLQDAVAERTMTVAYNRAGLGQSEPGPEPRDAIRIADELSALLEVLNIKAPVILVGHSFGGLYARVYAHRYPDRVAGVLLLDPSSEQHEAFVRDSDPARYDQLINSPELRDQGIRRAFGTVPPGWYGQQRSRRRSSEQARAAWPLPAVPAAVVSAMVPLPSEYGLRDATMVKARVEANRAVAERIPGARHIVLDTADHNTVVEQARDPAHAAGHPRARARVPTTRMGSERFTEGRAQVTDPLDWERLYGEWRGHWAAILAGRERTTAFHMPAVVVGRVTHPADADARWLIDALRDDGEYAQSRKWFVAALAEGVTAMAEVLFQPMLDAAIDEVDPSFNRYFVEPCMESFGPRRVNEYLLSVVASGTDVRKAGAVNALYWAHVPLTFPGGTRSFDIEYATPASRAEYEALQDIWTRRQLLLLETFVDNTNVDVRRSIIPSLDVDPQNYPESHRPLVHQAIRIARSHDDEYIRHRIQVQLGDDSDGLAPLPHRDSKNPTT
jgi:pimeloyl-ACP methyl ester carboxylesterase